MQTTILLYFMLLTFLDNTHELFKNLRKQFKFLKQLRKKEIFNMSFTDELELLENRSDLRYNWVTEYLYKRMLMKKFIQQLREVPYKPKVLSSLNSSISIIFSLESDENFRGKILSKALIYEKIILNEVDNFDKLDKAYVLKRLFDFFNGKYEYTPFNNYFNIIMFKKAGSFALEFKKAILLDFLDDIQKENIRKFAA